MTFPLIIVWLVLFRAAYLIHQKERPQPKLLQTGASWPERGSWLTQMNQQSNHFRKNAQG